MRDIGFGRILLLTDAVPKEIAVPPEIQVRIIEPLGSREAYSRFMLKGLFQHIDTPFALVTQWDGYVANPDAWDAAFLSCDYLGARWPEAPKRICVGNGGFSLRSRKLLAGLQDERVELTANEDQVICGPPVRDLLEDVYGIRFGTPKMADRFSFETDARAIASRRRIFGFHGLFNFFAVESEPALVELCDQLTDDIAQSEFCLLLARNCFNFKQWQAAQAIGRRILQCNPQDVQASEIVKYAEVMSHAGDAPAAPATSRLALKLLSRFMLR